MERFERLQNRKGTLEIRVSIPDFLSSKYYIHSREKFETKFDQSEDYRVERK